MNNSYAEVIAQVTANAQDHVVAVSLSIHDDNGGAWNAAGSLRYRRVRSLPRGFSHQLSSRAGGPGNDQVKVLNNFAYDVTRQGSWGEYQSFIVTEPAAELWAFSLMQEIPSRLPGRPPVQNAPLTLSVSMPLRPQRGAWTLELRETEKLLIGVGAAPFDASLRAAFILAFHEVSSYAEVN